MATPVPDSSLKGLLAPGRLFEQKYRIISQLGTGSFAVVVKARHEVMGRDVALKCLKPSVVRASPDVSARFVTEVQIVSRLRHPNTVTIFDFGHTQHELAYMVLEYLDGETLDELIDAQGALSEARALRICRQILKSLDEAHALGIVHRDLKPSNIMLTELHGEPDFVKVLDFGVAKLLNETNSRDNKDEPRSTQFIGTPIYMSPEQVLGKPVTPASDLYSLGLLLYQMLSGDTPIAHESVAAVVREHLAPGPLPFSALNKLSPQMRRVILKATARAPADRFQTVQEFLDADIFGAAPLHAADASSEHLRVRRPSAQATSPGLSPGSGLSEETSEPDIFSGKNYIEMPEPTLDSRVLDSGALHSGALHSGAFDSNSPNSARSNHRKRQSSPQRINPAAARDDRRRSSTPTRNNARRAASPAPSLRTDELDLDLESIDRQRRRAEHQRRKAATPRARRSSADPHNIVRPRKNMARANAAGGDSAGFGASVLGPRILLYTCGLVAGYWAFVTLAATMHGQSDALRWAGGALVVVVALLGSRFSGTRVVRGDFGQRWLIPTARNLIIICALVVVAAMLAWPLETAAGLREDPTWFLRAFPAVPPFTWADALTSDVARTLAAFLSRIDAILPY
jgi:serine/threonine protein kinase